MSSVNFCVHMRAANLTSYPFDTFAFKLFMEPSTLFAVDPVNLPCMVVFALRACYFEALIREKHNKKC